LEHLKNISIMASDSVHSYSWME